ncbi:SMI1/KNR4 family protein [Photobacterium sanguinicancri]|uniref:SMI1/KNR4 family protein n=1 Tax=Photobacterium sanguinicancri TaxID=875932 RepID=UPI003D107C7F
MKELFSKFKKWLKDNYEDGFKDLNPPATDSDIHKLEQTLGFAIPVDLTACLKIHNGQANNAGGLFAGSEFLSTERIADEWIVWKDLLDSGDFAGFSSDPDKGIQSDWWNQKWIPFTYNGCGDHLCVDADPASFGTVGQVITMWHDSSERELLAHGFSEWFADYVKAILEGRYVYSDDYGCIVPIEDV